MKMLENIVNGTKKIATGLALAGALVAGPKADAVETNIHAGIAIPGDLSNNYPTVTNGQRVTLGVYVVSTNGIPIQTLQPTIQLGGAGDIGLATNTFKIDGAFLLADSSMNVTSPTAYFYGLDLNSLSKIDLVPSSAGKLAIDETLNDTSQRTTGQGFAGIWTGVINYSGLTNYDLSISIPTMRAYTNDSIYYFIGSGTRPIGNDINPNFKLRVAAVPEPGAGTLVGLGLAGMLLLRKWTKRD